MCVRGSVELDVNRLDELERESGWVEFDTEPYPIGCFIFHLDFQQLPLLCGS